MYRCLVAEYCGGEEDEIVCEYPPGRCGKICDGTRDCDLPHDEDNCTSKGTEKQGGGGMCSSMLSL